MKECVRDWLRREDGVAVIWFLMFIPVMVAALTYVVTLTQTVTTADVDLQGALEGACRAGAMQVTAESQAHGNPRINAARAVAAFCRELARNLGLDPTSLAPLPGSTLKTAPLCVLVVYNGDDAYSAGGAPAGRKYVISGGTGEYNVSGAGFPYTFGVTSNDILPGAGGTFQVELETPGVVAVADTTMVRVVGRHEVRPVRWAAARVVRRR